jgi:ferredoxin
MAKVKIINQQLEVDCNPGLSILNNFLDKGAPIHTVCGGKGLCGCCRIKIIGSAKGTSPVNDVEKARLSNELTNEGWRLACQTYTLRDLEINLPTSEELNGRCSNAD